MVLNSWKYILEENILNMLKNVTNDSGLTSLDNV